MISPEVAAVLDALELLDSAGSELLDATALLDELATLDELLLATLVAALLDELLAAALLALLLVVATEATLD